MELSTETRLDKGREVHVGGIEIKQIRLLVGPYVLKNCGCQNDVDDIIQEGLLAYFQKLSDGHFELRTSVVQYIYGICKNKWIQELRRRRKEPISGALVSVNGWDEYCSQLETCRKEALTEIMIRNIRKLSDKCQQVLDYRMEGMNCEQIAGIMNLKGTQMVKDKHYRCKIRLKELIAEDPEFKALFDDR